MASLSKVLVRGLPRIAAASTSSRSIHCEGRPIKTVKLNNGTHMPTLGLGTWLAQPGEVNAAVTEALRIGYNHIDCAHIYFNEDEVGAAFHKAFLSGRVVRDDIWVTSKIWSGDCAPEDVRPACERTLKDLQLSYLDLYLMHWPQRVRKGCGKPGEIDPNDQLGYTSEMTAETWREMEKLVDIGLVRAIGVSNFTQRKLFTLLEDVKVKPAVHQVECHPYFQQTAMKDLCAQAGIQFQSYSPLGAPDRPPRNKEEDASVVMDDPKIAEIANRNNCSVAQVCIAWQYMRGVPLLTKSVHADRIAQNLAAKDVNLSEADLAAVDALDRNERLLYGRWAFKPGQGPYEFWDGENVPKPE